MILTDPPHSDVIWITIRQKTDAKLAQILRLHNWVVSDFLSSSLFSSVKDQFGPYVGEWPFSPPIGIGTSFDNSSQCKESHDNNEGRQAEKGKADCEEEPDEAY
ncbi:uncharacterized protein MYCFIDRAFT_170046 [Pseudocercospora fijiensis CIRAD86]|uniref:Uncharacterized protein n=1 Tax=Pseudocercospora fijiensis (strain CIRAD86) TaxID=383855 RepID=N1QBC7_PSEFD|nr:uncharacterized protein MYCFIDRAFT_170046 [Pseudocercospora fijiensis CIRAD86]EME88428.1 hypothetical protein MYCFIDRAFT_170046 [Pseudocercospora fijiensis CIRAD86]